MSAGDPTVEDVRIPGPNGGFLAATLYLPRAAGREHLPAERPPGLLVGHGAGSNRRRHDAFCRVACSAELAVLSFDFRGHGESTGLLDGPAEDDILAAAEFLRADQRVDGRRLGYRGSSMGGYYGLRAAPRADFAALALLCPAVEAILRAALGEETGRGERRDEGLLLKFDADAFRTYLDLSDVHQDAARITAPVLLVHARGDAVVPLEESLRIAERLAGPAELVIMPDGGHSSAQGSASMHRRVAGWLAERLRESRAT